VKRLLLAGEHGSLVQYDAPGGDAALAVPTPEHTCRCCTSPARARPASPRSSRPGIDGGSVSMLTVRLG
jgi:hypothetical protein